MINGNFRDTSKWKLQGPPGWVQIKTIVDSGAAKSIAPPSFATGVAVVESEMSRRGQTFLSADNGRIENQGEQHIHVTTNEGMAVTTTVQVGDVLRPLMSVSQACDKGNWVLFTSKGGSVYNFRDRTYTDFDRDDDTYIMDWWLTSEEANGKLPQPSHQNEPTDDGNYFGSLRSFKDMLTGGPGFTRQGR